MNIRQASQQDVERIMQLRNDAARWLASIGSDQWSEVSIDAAEFRRRVEQSVARGETWVATDEHDHALGTIAIDEHTNPGLWTKQEMADALVIHRMIRAREAPSGTGRVLLDHAVELARRAGKRWLRLDAWTTNDDLHRYYESQGFRHVRTVSEHHTRSAALFELPVSPEVIVQSSINRPVTPGGEIPKGNPSPPDHWHRVDDLTVHAEHASPQQGPLEIPNHSHPLHLWHDGSRWLISANSPAHRYNSRTKTVLNWENSPALRNDRQYLIEHQETTEDCRVVLHAVDTPQEGAEIDHMTRQDRP